MIADILGVQKSTIQNVVNLNERLKATKIARKSGPSGISREVIQLYGNASLVSLPIQINEGFRSRRDGNSATRWVWCQFNNSAHPASCNIHLHHWHPLNDATKRDSDLLIKDESKESTNGILENKTLCTNDCCYYTANSDYGPAAFNKKAQVVRYSPSFYGKHIAPNSSGWTSWETDYLFDLCEEFDLRFLIISDRYGPVELLREALPKAKEGPAIHHHHSKSRRRSDSILGSFSATAALTMMTADQIKSLIHQIEPYQPRPIEQLKDRYYTIARSLIEEEFKKKINSFESRFADLSQSIESSNVETLAHQRTQLLAETKEELNRHPLIKFHYDPVVDKQRREYLDHQYRTGEKERRSEKQLLQQISKAEAVSKKVARDESSGAKKKKSIGSGASPVAASGVVDETQLNQLPLEAVQQHLALYRRPGTILASQLMQQFAAPLLLAQPASTLPTGSGGSAGNATGRHSTGGHHHHHHYHHALQILKKHEQKIEVELKALGFDSSKGVPLWPNYIDREIVEAFNCLRIDVATLVQCNAKVEQLEKERSVWRAKVSQMKEESLGSNTPMTSQEPGREQEMDHLSTQVTNKKKHVRQSIGTTGERPAKKPRKSSSKKAASGNQAAK